MNAKRLFHVSLPVLLLWLVSLPVHAAVEAGRILFARGTVSIVDASDAARGAGTGSVFHEGDRVVTGNNSIVQLRLSDGALTALRSNSDYQIQRQRFDEEADVYEQAGRLLSGWMRSVTGAIGARYPGNVSQGTSVATIGIRGTTYQIIHVPEEGLAEFPNLQPGTYVYLEEGQVEVSNAAGSRIVSPGQVVRVPGPDAAPELAPELTELFQSEVLQGAGSGDSDGVTVRDLLANTEDAIVDDVLGGPAPPLGSPVFALMSCSGCPGGLTELANNVESSDIGGTGQGRYVQTAFIPQSTFLEGLPGKTPTDMGYYAFSSEGQVVAQVHWGRWREGDYLYSSEPGFGSWGYIFADNVVLSPESIGLTGSYRYSLADSSPFRGTASEGQTVSTTLNKNSFVDVDFGSFSAEAALNFNNGDSLVGGGSLEELYNFGLSLSGTGENSMLFGNMQGAFVGGNGEGLISLINYTDSMTYESYSGSAVFQQGGPPPAPEFGGVSAFATFSPSKGVLEISTLELGLDASGINLFPTYAQVDTGAQYELIGNSTEPSTPVSSMPIVDANDNVVVNVYWGIWDQASYLINEISEGPVQQTPTSDWHFMIADNPLSESMVASIGLTGQYIYGFVDGTAGIGAGSTIGVNFGDLTASNAIDVNLELFGSTTGSGSLSDLYSPAGIALVNVSDPIFGGGSLSGTFAGAGAEALLTTLTYDYNGDPNIGTALFQQDPIPVVAQ